MIVREKSQERLYDIRKMLLIKSLRV